MPSESSLAQYAKVVAALEKRGIDFAKHEDAMNIITTKANGEPTAPNTILNILSAIKAVLLQRGIDDPFYFKEHGRRMEERTQTATYTKHPTKFIEWTELERRSAEDPDNLLLAVYVRFPPRRLDWRIVKVVKSDMGGSGAVAKYNYWIPSLRMLRFYEYKTKGTYGVQTFILNESHPLLPILMKEAPKAEYGGFLFHESAGTPYESSAFSKFVKRKTGGYTINDLRHSFVTNFLATNPSVDKKLKVSKMMAHHIGTQALYQRDDPLSDEE
tara:strand:+ start:129 stop:941 length:813 start_codon:yes stop_codon:yes gene_type:complete